jgi:hypothetical protein
LANEHRQENPFCSNAAELTVEAVVVFAGLEQVRRDEECGHGVFSCAAPSRNVAMRYAALRIARYALMPGYPQNVVVWSAFRWLTSFTDSERFGTQRDAAQSQGGHAMTDHIRQPITVRLKAEDKALFAKGAEECGLEPGTAARQLIELVIQRMRTEGDYVDALQIVKNALRVSKAA